MQILFVSLVECSNQKPSNLEPLRAGLSSSRAAPAPDGSLSRSLGRRRQRQPPAPALLRDVFDRLACQQRNVCTRTKARRRPPFPETTWEEFFCGSLLLLLLFCYSPLLLLVVLCRLMSSLMYRVRLIAPQ